MSSLAQFKKGLLTAGILVTSLSGVSGCGPDYALFNIHVKASPRSTLPAPDGSDNTAINQCEMTIKDQNGKVVLDRFHLKPVTGADAQGQPKLLAGCQSGLTPTDIGLFSYSTSNTTGTFTFTVDGWNTNRDVLLQTGTCGPIAAKVFPPEMPEALLTMSTPK
jgi:hypothetical protein